MGNFRPLPTRCFVAFLLLNGFTYNRTTASHDVYTRKGTFRSVIIREKDKDIPALHLKTNCQTIGCTLDVLYNWAETNC